MQKKEFKRNEEDLAEFFEGEISQNIPLAPNDFNKHYDFEMKMENNLEKYSTKLTTDLDVSSTHSYEI